MLGSVKESDDGNYRYVLSREWDSDGRYILFIGLNPKLADNQQNDSVTRRYIEFAKQLGYGELKVVNLFAKIATLPSKLTSCINPVGKANDQHIEACVRDADMVIVCWGKEGLYQKRSKKVAKILKSHLNKVYHMGWIDSNVPINLLYAKLDTTPKKVKKLS